MSLTPRVKKAINIELNRLEKAFKKSIETLLKEFNDAQRKTEDK